MSAVCGSAAARRRIAVVVLGDLARSPRMCLHATSAAAAGFAVDVFACVDGEVPQAIARSAEISVHPLPPAPSLRAASPVSIVPRLVAHAARVAGILFGAPAPAAIIVQNPPALFVLPALILLAQSGARLIVDWHNYGWTVLRLRLGERPAVLRVAGALERFLARLVDRHLCVSETMRRDLRQHHAIDALVFADRPAASFLRVRGVSREDARRRVLPLLGLGDELEMSSLCDGRAALLVSPTSWTADEDFSLLIDALRRLRAAREEGRVPPLVVALSGRGEARAQFESMVARSGLTHCHVVTTWVAAADYPLLLAAADLGICLHRSTSGVDLPMKLADMIGVGLPACVLNYGDVLAEVLPRSYFTFDDAAGLAGALLEALRGFPGAPALRESRRRLGEHIPQSWEDAWAVSVAPLIEAAG